MGPCTSCSSSGCGRSACARLEEALPHIRPLRRVNADLDFAAHAWGLEWKDVESSTAERPPVTWERGRRLLYDYRVNRLTLPQLAQAWRMSPYRLKKQLEAAERKILANASGV